MRKTKPILQLAIVLVCFINLTTATIGPPDKKKKKDKQTIESPEENKTVDTTVTQRGLVTSAIKDTNSIIENHFKYCQSCSTQKNFDNIVLGYVTPWNSHGYSIAKQFANKFNYISPVWLQIKRLKYKSYSLAGTHDIDKKWMADVRKNSEKKVKFLPRILFEKWTAEDLHALFNDEDEMIELCQMLVDSANKYKFSGYVLEIYSQLHGFGKHHINHFINDLANALHASKNKKLVLVIPPAYKTDDPRKEKESDMIFNKNDFEILKDVVDSFSLMTYDFASHSSQVASNAPYDWIRHNVEYFTGLKQYRKKILIGLNFYGMKYSMELLKRRKPNAVEAVTGKTFIELLKNFKVDVKYDAHSEEHTFNLMNSDDDSSFNILNAKLIVFFPTLYSIQKRIELAEELGTGISIWELGQGLDYFYDLL
jgi:chitinase domain-containing protein 1